MGPDLLDRFAAAFTVLARLHIAPVSAEDHQAIGAMIDEWPVDGAVDEGIALMRASVAGGEDVAAIRWDHDTLYGISAAAKVAPYESVHRGEDGLVFDEHTLAVRAAFARLDVQAPRLHLEPDDHVGLELDFLAKCCLAMLDALDAGDTSRAEHLQALAHAFTEEHLAAWAPQMLRDAQDAATTKWMRGLMALTLGTVAAWQAHG
ncbi:TorD/DmsD family molecular chaperone [Corynebacterium uterequi]|uniref:Putative component of anaerobic dehydrogenase n=1 Tax=Corynebacterium uterequi TaxID=1072256 RepID=A0A0G3HGH0_9CORY|nr:molecular chaperone TorD family protein [Corynebacterium uterequi]AKK10217.1 putative component of anaerobic dehydrogenase [Corynebacterium uterequi]